MTVKDFFKDATKEGAKLAGKTIVKSAFDVKTWVMVYMAIVLSKGYNKLGNVLDREAEINRDAAQKIEQRISTPEGMQETCEKYHLTEEEVKEVIATQKEMSHTQSAVMKTAQDSKKSWRDYLPFADALTKKGTKDGLALKNSGQLSLAMDAHEAAEADMKKKEQLKVRAEKGMKR